MDGPVRLLDATTIDVLRQMTGAERLAVANRMFQIVRDDLASSLRAQHPDWSDDRLQREVGRRILDGVEPPPTLLSDALRSMPPRGR